MRPWPGPHHLNNHRESNFLVIDVHLLVVVVAVVRYTYSHSFRSRDLYLRSAGGYCVTTIQMDTHFSYESRQQQQLPCGRHFLLCVDVTDDLALAHRRHTHRKNRHKITTSNRHRRSCCFPFLFLHETRRWWRGRPSATSAVNIFFFISKLFFLFICGK